MKSLEEFRKKKKFLVCIDSDGCAMDTMDIKHIQCFGPCMITQWSLEAWQTEILNRWNEINLYSNTRGINRFKGLALMLEEINKKYCKIEDCNIFMKWVNESIELSNTSLLGIMNTLEIPIFQKALKWSEDVNASIAALDQTYIQPFDGVLDAIKKVGEVADIAIVSSANEEALKEEWEKHGLLTYVDVLLSQKVGSKQFCIDKLLEKGYDSSNVLMIGDAPGDQYAAISNKVNFYPILVRKEEDSWRKLQEIVLAIFLEGNYSTAYQHIANEEFITNLSTTV